MVNASWFLMRGMGAVLFGAKMDRRVSTATLKVSSQNQVADQHEAWESRHLGAGVKLTSLIGSVQSLRCSFGLKVPCLFEVNRLVRQAKVILLNQNLGGNFL